MTEQQAVAVLEGAAPVPEDMTVEAVFADAHIVPHPITPF